MFLTLSLTIKPRIVTTKKWRIGKPEQWKEYNSHFNESTRNKKPTNATELTELIIQCLHKTIGKATIKIGKPKKITSQEIKDARSNRKTQKTIFSKALKTKKPDLIEKAKYSYIQSQQKLRELVQKNIAEDTKQSIRNLTKNWNMDMNKFWAIRRKILGYPKDEYNILDEDNKLITSSTLAKTHVAGYYENLYQAREGESQYQEWTKQVENTVEAVTKRSAGESCSEITKCELESAIKQLQRRKAVDPDDIPNEALIESGDKMRKNILTIFNNIYKTEEIPQEWKHGMIIRIYKGKGKKGQCCNEKDITVSSYLNKLFERIINNKIIGNINITECQGGVRKGASTTNHLKIINTYIKTMSRKKNTIYITFLDVTKAWIQAIIYAMHKSGITGELLRLVKKINENLTATIETKYGDTRKIQIKDSIRQGGVLAVVAYANLMDEIAKEIKENKENLIPTGNNEKPGCLLWMDDVVLLHTDKKQMQEMLNTTHEIVSRYRIKFGAAKSKVLIIGKDKAEFKIGNLPIEEATTYNLDNTIKNNARSHPGCQGKM